MADLETALLADLPFTFGAALGTDLGATFFVSGFAGLLAATDAASLNKLPVFVAVFRRGMVHSRLNLSNRLIVYLALRY